MVDAEAVIGKIMAYLNGQIAQDELVHWAEDAFVELSESERDVPNEAAVLDVLGYIGAADSPGFPLTWGVLRKHLNRLGVDVRAVRVPP